MKKKLKYVITLKAYTYSDFELIKKNIILFYNKLENLFNDEDDKVVIISKVYSDYLLYNIYVCVYYTKNRFSVINTFEHYISKLLIEHFNTNGSFRKVLFL